MTAPKPVVLCILDGWGLRDDREGNAPLLAHTPHFDRIMQGPNAQLLTHGPDAGLPSGQMGNSEVGHMNLGAGRIVNQDIRRIDAAIEDASIRAAELGGRKDSARARGSFTKMIVRDAVIPFKESA